MKTLKSQSFDTHGQLVYFVSVNGITKENILSVTSSRDQHYIFYYA